MECISVDTNGLRHEGFKQGADPSLAVAAVGSDAGRLLADLEWFGFLFEGAVLRDIRVFSQALDARTYHYRDESGLEADIVIEFPDGRWIAVEVKLGHSQVDQAAANLVAIRHRVDAQSTGEAVALVVVTATGAACTRSDGVIVLPACALGEERVDLRGSIPSTLDARQCLCGARFTRRSRGPRRSTTA